MARTREPAFVYIVDTTLRVPVYHERHGDMRVDVNSRQYVLTTCNLRVYSWDAVLRLRHAALFARRCKACWPRTRTGQPHRDTLDRVGADGDAGRGEGAP